MATPVYTRQLLAALIAPGSAVASQLVPDGQTWIVRDITGTLQAPPYAPAGVLITVDGFEIFAKFWIGPKLFMCHWSGRVEAPGGSTLVINTLGVETTVDLTMTGYIFNP